jgi:hypothetical protein
MLIVLLPSALAGAESSAAADAPRFTAAGELVRPPDCREWVFLTSGLGMTYGVPPSKESDAPRFDNVFVTRAAYRSFLQTGRWPDKTMFILEVRSSQSKGSINNGGHFQTDMVAMEAEVKDESRYPGKWAFFSFADGASTAKPLPTTERCYTCHAQNGAVDNTFVQFYPVLLKVAREKGTAK